MGIVGWIIDKIVEIGFSTIGRILVWFTGLFAEIFGFSFDAFTTVFPGYSKLLQIIIAFGITISFLIYIWQLIRCIVGAISGDVDDPFLMSFKLIFVVFAIYFWLDIVFMVRKIFIYPFAYISAWSRNAGKSFEAGSSLSTILNQRNKTSTDNTLAEVFTNWINSFSKVDFTSALKKSSITAFTGGTADLSGIVIKLILLIAIGWNYVKYLIEYIERYVLFVILTLLAPLAIGTAISKQTNDISKKFARMYASSMFMIVMAHLGLVMINIAFANCAAATNGKLDFIVWCLIVYATLIVMQKIDKHFAAAGMNTAQTGGAMLDLAATAMSTFRSLQKNGQGFLTGLTGVKGGLAGLAGAKVANEQAKNNMSKMITAFRGGQIGEEELKKGAKDLSKNKAINSVTKAALENSANKEIADRQHGNNQKALDTISKYLNGDENANKKLAGAELQNDLDNKNRAYGQLNEILNNKNSTPADKARATQLKASIENDVKDKISKVSNQEDLMNMNASAPDILKPGSDVSKLYANRVIQVAKEEKQENLHEHFDAIRNMRDEYYPEDYTTSKESQSHSVPITKNTTSSKKSNVSSSFNEEK